MAVKLLAQHLLNDEAAKARFVREAHAASALDHPNIGTVYDICEDNGQLFIVMALYDGQTLSQYRSAGPVSVEESLVILRQLLLGLETAHRAGIVHRDVKPSNILITSRGTLKILDFGLAKPMGETQARMTQAGQAIGTLLYMSPEQLAGRAIDARTDLWSVGVLAYELLAGVSPFDAGSNATTAARILHERPASLAAVPGIPEWLDQLLMQLLEKNPADRPQTAGEVLRRLEANKLSGPTQLPPALKGASPLTPRMHWQRQLALALAVGLVFGTAGWWALRSRAGHNHTGAIRSLAVLPLDNFSADDQQEYLTDGMTEALIADLSQIRALRVVSRTSAMQYKKARKPLKEIARQLNADLVVEGSVVRAGDRVQVTAQLIDAASDRHLWAKSYERELSNVIALQRDLARTIAREIRVSVTPQEQARLAKVDSVNPEAHEAYLMGRYLWNKRSEASLRQALAYFQQSLEKDPAFAPAYAGIAATYNLMQFYAGFSPHTVFPKSKAAARKALELDETLAEAHVALAYVTAYYDWDWASAEREFQRALELNPNYAEAYQSYGRFLAARGRVDEALVKIRQAQERNPVPLTLKANEAVILYFARRNDQAIEQLRKTLELDPNFALAHWGLGLVEEQRGAFVDAVAQFQKAIALSNTTANKAAVGHTYAVMGDRSSAQRVLEDLSQDAKLSYVPSYYAATIYAGLGDKDQAFASLERAYEEHSTLLAYLKMDPRFDPLRSDRRFSDLLGRVGLASP